MRGDERGFIEAVLESPGDDTPRLVYADWLEEHAGTEECRACIKGESIVTAFKKCQRCGGSGRLPDGRTERAEFIRVQCRLQSDPWVNYRCVMCGDEGSMGYEFGPFACAHCPDRAALLRRERELLLEHWRSWVPMLNERGTWEVISWVPMLNERGTWEVILSPKWTPSRTPAVLFRRGFVDEVRCTAPDWIRHGRKIVRCQPVTKVVQTDRGAAEYALGIEPMSEEKVSRDLIEWARRDWPAGKPVPVPRAIL